MSQIIISANDSDIIDKSLVNTAIAEGYQDYIDKIDSFSILCKTDQVEIEANKIVLSGAVISKIILVDHENQTNEIYYDVTTKIVNPETKQDFAKKVWSKRISQYIKNDFLKIKYIDIEMRNKNEADTLNSIIDQAISLQNIKIT